MFCRFAFRLRPCRWNHTVAVDDLGDGSHMRFLGQGVIGRAGRQEERNAYNHTFPHAGVVAVRFERGDGKGGGKP